MQKSEQICLLSLGVQNTIQKIRRDQTCSEWMLENLQTLGVILSPYVACFARLSSRSIEGR